MSQWEKETPDTTMPDEGTKPGEGMPDEGTKPGEGMPDEGTKPGEGGGGQEGGGDSSDAPA